MHYPKYPALQVDSALHILSPEVQVKKKDIADN